MSSSRPVAGRGTSSSSLDGHVIPHSASFRNALDTTHGDIEKNLENMRAIQYAQAHYVSPRTRLKQRLSHYSIFNQARPEFISILLENAAEEHLEANQVLWYVNHPCVFGETPFYIVLDGQMTVENAMEVVLGYVYEGEICGEGGALGLTEERTVTIRVSKGKPSTILRIEGSALESALISCPEMRDHFEDTFYRRQTANQEFERRREVWVMQTAMPILAGAALFAGCPEEFLYDVAAPLTEKTYKDGQTIVVCGEAADSMLVVLEGEADIEAKSGAKITRLGQGASFGEVACLDLFPCRTATLRASGRCRILNVTSKALKRAIGNSPEELVRVAFSRLEETRREQVQRGLPICALPINTNADDVAVRAVALQAERIDLAPGQTWTPLPDADVCGPHFGVIVKGRAVLETVEERRLVTGLSAGSLFPEGLLAEYRTHVRATTHCEGYRVRQNDFLVTVYSMPSAQDWFYRFKVLDKQTREHLLSRLSAVRGVTDGALHRPSDDDIHEWKTRKEKAIVRARRRKADNALSIAKLPIMAQSCAHSFVESTGGRVFRSGPPAARAATSMSRVQSAPDLQRQDRDRPASVMDGLGDGSSAGSSLRLPRLQTAG